MKQSTIIDIDGQELIKKTWDSGCIEIFNKRGKLHCLSEPAFFDGIKYIAYYKDGKLHNTNGYAEQTSSKTQYFIEGVRYSKSKYKEYIKSMTITYSCNKYNLLSSTDLTKLKEDISAGMQCENSQVALDILSSVNAFLNR